MRQHGDQDVWSAVGVIWGAAVVVYALAGGGGDGSGAYEAGSFAGLAFGVVLLVAGGWTLAKSRRA